MVFRLILLSVFIFGITNTYSQEKAVNVIKKSDVVEYMKFLSSDALEGRRTGSEGNNEAARYISQAALKSGVKPLPGRKDLFQTLEYLRISSDPDSSLISICDTSGNRQFSSHVISLMAPADNINLSGEVVFAGYGYTNTGAKYNDLEGISVKDKIVIIMTRNPVLEGTGMPDFDARIDEMVEMRKLPMLMLQKAKAILFVADPALKDEDALSFLAASGSYQVIPLFKKQAFYFSINTYIISRETADKFLQGSRWDLASLQNRIASTKKPVSFVVPRVRAEITLRVKKDSVTSSNIVGYIEGSDSLLKNECIIYTAHYDHSGRDGSGNILNGANDNASGSIGLLNVAKVFNSLESKPLRSIVFLWTTGEEEGLHGSSFYVDNPLFPLEKTVANINFDMIGRSRSEADGEESGKRKLDITGKDTIKIISAHNCMTLINTARESCTRYGLYSIDEGKGTHFSGSDHFHFHRNGIPAVFFFTGLHHDYHRSTDDFEFIDFEKLVKVSKAGFLTGYLIANNPERPAVEKDSK